METPVLSRWQEIKKTTPSGKTLFVCMSCGRSSPVPDNECPGKISVYFEGYEHMIPCSAWPKNPRQYAEAKMAEENMEAYFSGTVTLPDGTLIQVSAPIPGEIAMQISCLSVEFDLTYAKRKAANAEKLKRQLDAMAIEAASAKNEERLANTNALQELQRMALENQKAQKAAVNIPSPVYRRQAIPNPTLPQVAPHPAGDWVDQYRKTQGK